MPAHQDGARRNAGRINRGVQFRTESVPVESNRLRCLQCLQPGNRNYQSPFPGPVWWRLEVDRHQVRTHDSPEAPDRALLEFWPGFVFALLTFRFAPAGLQNIGRSPSLTPSHTPRRIGDRASCEDWLSWLPGAIDERSSLPRFVQHPCVLVRGLLPGLLHHARATSAHDIAVVPFEPHGAATCRSSAGTSRASALRNSRWGSIVDSLPGSALVDCFRLAWSLGPVRRSGARDASHMRAEAGALGRC